MHLARTDRQLSTYIYYRSCFRYRTAERLAEFLTSKLLASDGKSKDAAIQYEGHTTKRLFNVKVSTTYVSYMRYWPRERSKATDHSRDTCYTNDENGSSELEVEEQARSGKDEYRQVYIIHVFPHV